MYRLKEAKYLIKTQPFIRTKSTSNVDEAYQLLQRSILPTYYFQKSLPRLPIPALDATCNRYLAAQQPLLDDKAYVNTQTLVDNFQNGIGKTLQQLLIEKDKKEKHTSYISEPWFDMYLKDRTPLPVNYNPLLMMKPDEKKEYNEQTLRATNMIISSLRFMKSLRIAVLEPEVFHLNPAKSDNEKFRRVAKMAPTKIATYVAYAFKAFPLDMSQYHGLFGATRIPEEGKDRIYTVDNPKHIVVMMKGHVFAVDVLDASGNIEEPSVIYSRLKKVSYLGSDCQENDYPIGSLTTENRDLWADLRHHLQSTGNGNSLRLIDSALFCLCLDDTTLDETNPIPMIKNLLYENCKDRWYDKSFSLIVTKDGTTAINFEHSWGDGVAVLRYFNEIYKDTINNPRVHPDTNIVIDKNVEQAVQQVNFDLDEKTKIGIKEAMRKHSDIVNSLDMNYLKYDGINREDCKQYQTSPDAVMQLAFQLAFFKQTNSFVATYESCSTAAFRHGRTETMRPCTNETKKFVDSINKGTIRSSKKELRALLDACSAKHNELTKQAAMGQGFDRHLFGLRHTADINDIPHPAIFTDPAYAAINHNILSTSTLSSPALAAGGFGPVVKDGYGIGYNIQNAFCGCVVANYRATRDGLDFIDCLKKSFEEIEEVLRQKKSN